jgi:hypothetical protein
MRAIDLHYYPGTQTWIDAQGSNVAALAKYWKRSWVVKSEGEEIFHQNAERVLGL